MPIETAAGRFAKIFDYTGLAAALSFAFCAWLSVSGANITLALLALAFFLNFPAWPAYRRETMFWLFVAFALYLLIFGCAATAEFPETSRLQYKDASNWLKLFAFLPLAWWLKGDPRRLEWVWMSAVAGLIIGMLMHVDWQLLSTLALPKRTGFKLKIIFSGLVASTLLLGFLIFASRFLSASARWVWGKRMVWITLLYLAVYMLLSTFSRGAWLAAAIVIPGMVLLRYKTMGLSQIHKAWLPALAVVVVLAVTVGMNAGKIEKRVLAEADVITSIVEGHQEALPVTSIAFRFHVQIYGVHKWLERPLLGWGPGSTEYLLAHSNAPSLLHPQLKGGVDWMDHLHNTYLEILLRFGVLGGAFIGTIVFLIGRGLVRAYRTGRAPREHVLFMAGAFGLLAIWSLFDFRALHADWRAYWVLLAGSAYSYALHKGDFESVGDMHEPA